MRCFIIEEKKIIEFRDRFNEIENELHKILTDENKNSQWFIICSCMDWIQIAARHLEVENFSTIDVSKLSLEPYSVISCIDIVDEVITQLHRIAFSTDAEPFKNEKKIFSKAIGFPDDREYFKHVRAIFGDHSVNLKDHQKTQWYASWPYKPFSNEGDLCVLLYCKDETIEDKQFCISFDELTMYLKHRYNYLDEVMAEFKRRIEVFKNDKRAKPITRSSDPIEQIEILKQAIHDRFDKAETHYYTRLLDNIKIAFSVTPSLSINNKKISDFQEKARPFIDIIYSRIQDMEEDNIDDSEFLWFDYPDELQYQMGVLYNPRSHPFKKPAFEKVIEFLGKFVEFDKVQKAYQTQYTFC